MSVSECVGYTSLLRIRHCMLPMSVLYSNIPAVTKTRLLCKVRELCAVMLFTDIEKSAIHA